jgi:hypothetical protein
VSEPRTQQEWAAYNALPEWEVTVRLARIARFSVHAVTAEDARARVAGGQNGVRSLDDLYSPDSYEIDRILSTEVTG